LDNKAFDIVDARCNHEDYSVVFYVICPCPAFLYTG